MHVDISVVLNIHREKELLAKTLQSLREAADFAAVAQISIELVMVLDNSCETTADIAHSFQADSLVAITRIEVDHRSLALSRNDGIAATVGEFVCITDADDLYSYNRFVDSIALARKLGHRFIILPEYLVSFGSNNGLSVLAGSGALTPTPSPILWTSA